jgi:polysaccharide export outer membrane protein
MKSVCLLRGVLAACLLASGSAQGQNVKSSYVLKPNDTIRIDMYEEPDLSGSVRILRSGDASFPLIGSMRISGLTVGEAAEKIRKAYAADYLVDPKLNLIVQDYSTDYISIIGAVRNAGQIPIPVSGEIDLVTAMTTAGGLAEHADSTRIQLVRASGGVTFHNFADIERGAAGRIRLSGGDRIIVGQSPFLGKTVTMLGEVGKPGPLPFPLGGRLDLVSAVSMAGGLTQMANPKKVTLNRGGRVQTIDYKEISESGRREILLQPGDIVTVAERLF